MPSDPSPGRVAASPMLAMARVLSDPPRRVDPDAPAPAPTSATTVLTPAAPVAPAPPPPPRVCTTLKLRSLLVGATGFTGLVALLRSPPALTRRALPNALGRARRESRGMDAITAEGAIMFRRLARREGDFVGHGNPSHYRKASGPSKKVFHQSNSTYPTCVFFYFYPAVRQRQQKFKGRNDSLTDNTLQHQGQRRHQDQGSYSPPRPNSEETVRSGAAGPPGDSEQGCSLFRYHAAPKTRSKRKRV